MTCGVSLEVCLLVVKPISSKCCINVHMRAKKAAYRSPCKAPSPVGSALPLAGLIVIPIPSKSAKER